MSWDKEKRYSVLFLPSNQASFKEMFLVAQYMKDNNMAQPIIFPERSGIDMPPNSENVAKLHRVSRISSIFLNILSNLVFILLFLSKHQREKLALKIKLRGRLRYASGVLHKYGIKSIVLRGDRHLGEGWEPAFIKASKDLNVRSVVLMYSYTSVPQTLLLRRRNKTFLIADEATQKRFPGQCIFDDTSQKYILYRPLPAIEALDEVGMLPRYPWVMGGGNSDLIMVSGENAKRRLVDLGCYPEKVRVTGIAAHDKLFHGFKRKIELRKHLFEKYDFDQSKLLLIISPTQFYEEKMMELKEAKEALSQLMDICVCFTANILVSLHPRMRRLIYKDIFAKYNMPVAEERLFEIINAADIYTSSFSSTVEWAIMCGIPTAIYDFYGFNYEIYDQYKGVVINKTEEEYRDCLKRIVSDREYRSYLTQQQNSSSPMLSPFDGRCMERIVKNIIE